MCHLLLYSIKQNSNEAHYTTMVNRWVIIYT